MAFDLLLQVLSREFDHGDAASAFSEVQNVGVPNGTPFATYCRAFRRVVMLVIQHYPLSYVVWDYVAQWVVLYNQTKYMFASPSIDCHRLRNRDLRGSPFATHYRSTQEPTIINNYSRLQRERSQIRYFPFSFPGEKAKI